MGFEDSSDEEGPEQDQRELNIFDYDIDSVEARKEEMLSKYPWAAEQIEDAISNVARFPRIKKKRAEQLLEADRYLQAFAVKGSNMSFEE